MSAKFKGIDLHDGYLTPIVFDWEKSICSLTMSAFLEGHDKNGIDCVLQFDQVSKVEIPHATPWGSSSYVHSNSEGPDGTFVIEMQSGDEIRIAARSFTIIKAEAAT